MSLVFEQEHKKIPKKYDRRYKLTDKDKQEIYNKYYNKNISVKELIKTYNVSKSTIIFIIHPEYLEHNKVNTVRVYNKEKHTKNMANYRHYKQQLEQKGLLID